MVTALQALPQLKRYVTAAGRGPRRAPADGFDGSVAAVKKAKKPKAEPNAEILERIPQWAHRYFTVGNKVTPLFDASVTPRNQKDEIFTQVKEMIRSAHRSVQVEMFNIDRKDVIDELIAKAKEGVDVQVIMDPPNEGWEKDRQKAIDRLRKGGVDVLLYPAREAGDKDAPYGQLDHIKMLLVDGTRAIIGGMNWGAHSTHNRDYNVAVEGPAVSRMAWTFREDWLESGGQSADLPRIEDVPRHPDGDALVNVITSGLDPKEQTIGKTVLRAIENARKSIHAELFVLSENATIDALIDAHNRGLDVKIILHPLKIKDNPTNEKAFNKLREAGVAVKWFVPNPRTKGKLHAKTATFDGDQVIVGSANWSYAGFKTNREANVEIFSKDVGNDFEKVFADDWKKRTSDEPHYLEDTDAGN